HSPGQHKDRSRPRAVALGRGWVAVPHSQSCTTVRRSSPAFPVARFARPMTQLIPVPRCGGRRVLFLNWRDLGSPLGGGSERYLHQVAAGLAGRGDVVTVRTAHYAGAARSEVLDGVRYLRRGTPNTVFPTALADLRGGRLGPVDVV